jgi:Tfp pilus assembly protein FimV
MFPSVRICNNSILFVVFFWLATALSESAAMDPRFELDSKALGVVDPPRKPSSVGAVSPKKMRKVKPPQTVAEANGLVHFVKSGENLFKILMRDYGFSNDEAEDVIERICRENNISDIRRLKVGQRVVIPSAQRIQAKTAIKSDQLSAAPPAQVTSRMQLRLEPPAAELSEQEATVQFQKGYS